MSYYKLFILGTVLLAVLLVATPALAITFGELDGERFPEGQSPLLE